jgi:L-ascorbate metabolism protein UlaG (beta-lactamase superfamily)
MKASALGIVTSLSIACAATTMGQRPAADTVPASGGDITIAPITHGTVHVVYGPHAILVDPTTLAGYDGTGRLTVNYDGLPAPTLVLVTDVHGDHLDPQAIATLKSSAAKVLVPAAAQSSVEGSIAIANGETRTIDGITVQAVPMYNLQRGYHEKGRGNGYVVTLGGKRLYFAGDTECTPEMKALENIDIAFLPMNLPYTMTPQEAADCAKAFKPKIAYPYHYRGQDVREFEAALKGTTIEVRLRDWYMR